MPEHESEAARRRPTQRRSRELVGSILTAASRLIAQTPLERLSTSRIAEVAGVSIGSLYQYFNDKQSIVQSLIEHKARADIDELAARIDRESGGTLAALLRAVVDTTVKIHRREPSVYAAILPLVPLLGRFSFVRRLVDEARDKARVEVENRRAEVRDGDIDLMMFVASAAIERVVHAAVLERPELLNDPRFAEELAILATRYLAKE